MKAAIFVFLVLSLAAFALGCPATGYLDVDEIIKAGIADALDAGAYQECGADSPDADTVPECVSAEDCGDPVDPACGVRACNDGQCVRNVIEGPISSQLLGDCQRIECRAGKLIALDDDADFFDDSNECTLDFCQNGAVLFVLPDGSPAPSGGGYCYQGTRVDCIANDLGAACANPLVCDGTFCEPFTPECMGGCGAPCAPCADGESCIAGDECQSLVCAGGFCAAPSCLDGVKNGTETDLDCGGDCDACAGGQACHLPTDCESGVCAFGQCKFPTCSDGLQNGMETGIDCGAACPVCE